MRKIIDSNSIRQMLLAAMAVAGVMSQPAATAAITSAELEQAREDIKALSAKNDSLRSRYVMDGARFAKSHHPSPLLFDVGTADDFYESALGAQNSVLQHLAVVAESDFDLNNFGIGFDQFPRRLEEAQARELEAIAKYAAVRDTKLSKSDRACYERQVAATRMARQKHEETLLMATRYLAMFGGGTPEQYAERKRQILEAEQAYYAEQDERRKITDESALLLLLVLAGLAAAP